MNFHNYIFRINMVILSYRLVVPMTMFCFASAFGVQVRSVKIYDKPKTKNISNQPGVTIFIL